MEEKTLQDIFIKILRCELTETELDCSVLEQITPDILSDLYSLANRHDLAHIVSSCLHKYELLTDEKIKLKYTRQEIISVYRYEQMKRTYAQICDIFNRESIPYIPLKGSVVRQYYPKESMRTSCDIDILVKEENLDAAVNALTQEGFRRGKKNYHDISLFSDTNIHLELHFSILEGIDSLDSVLKNAWDFAVPTETSEYRFTQEFFLFHFFAHISYHFLSGGCGIKPLMDVWIIKHKMGLTYESASVLLEKAGIYRFAAEISGLAEVCFDDKPEDEFSDTLMSYIFSGGVYGTHQNLIAVKKEETKSTLGYSMQRLFMPYKKMIIIFPVLKKLPFLLPFCWIIRFFNMLRAGKITNSFAEIKTANSVSDGEIERIKQMKKKLGL